MEADALRAWKTPEGVSHSYHSHYYYDDEQDSSTQTKKISSPS